MNPVLRGLLVSGLFLLGVGAHCSLAQSVERKASAPVHRLSVTIAPIALLLPIVEGSIEVRIKDRVGVAGILGVGVVENLDILGTKGIQHASVRRIGGEVNHYFLGNFDHGMQLGAKLMYTNVSGTLRGQQMVWSFEGFGMFLAPYAGYKVGTGFGVTCTVQGGVGVETLFTSTRDITSGDEDASGGTGLAPLLNLTVGWSF